MTFRTPKPLEAAILLVLAAVVERGHLEYRSEEEIFAALKEAGHHPSKNVFRLAMRRMEEDEMIVKAHRLPGRESFHRPRVYGARELEGMIEGEFLKAEDARLATTVYGVDGYYISKLTGTYLEEDEPRPALTYAAFAAAETFCQNAWGRSAYA